MLPTSLSLLLAGPIAGAYGRRHGSHGPLIAGMALVAIGSAGIALFHAEPWQPAAWFILCGIGIGFSFAVMPKLIVDAVRPTETGIATGMNTACGCAAPRRPSSPVAARCASSPSGGAERRRRSFWHPGSGPTSICRSARACEPG